MTSPLPRRCCPRCQSEHVHRSHRRSTMDRLFHALGAEIRRCHQCQFRYAQFIKLVLPLGASQAKPSGWATVAVTSTAFLLCLGFVLWIIRRLTGFSG